MAPPYGPLPMFFRSATFGRSARGGLPRAATGPAPSPTTPPTRRRPPPRLVGEERGHVGERDAAGARQRRAVDRQLGLGARLDQRVGEDEGPRRRCSQSRSLAVARGEDVARKGVRPIEFSTARGAQPHRQLRLHDHRRDARRAPRRPCPSSSSIAAAGLMSGPPVSKRAPFPTSVMRASSAPQQVDQPRLPRVRRRTADGGIADSRRRARQQRVALDVDTVADVEAASVRARLELGRCPTPAC